jgi:hypothetical protein
MDGFRSRDLEVGRRGEARRDGKPWLTIAAMMGGVAASAVAIAIAIGDYRSFCTFQMAFEYALPPWLLISLRRPRSLVVTLTSALGAGFFLWGAAALFHPCHPSALWPTTPPKHLWTWDFLLGVLNPGDPRWYSSHQATGRRWNWGLYVILYALFTARCVTARPTGRTVPIGRSAGMWIIVSAATASLFVLLLGKLRWTSVMGLAAILFLAVVAASRLVTRRDLARLLARMRSLALPLGAGFFLAFLWSRIGRATLIFVPIVAIGLELMASYRSAAPRSFRARLRLFLPALWAFAAFATLEIVPPLFHGSVPTIWPPALAPANRPNPPNRIPGVQR